MSKKSLWVSGAISGTALALGLAFATVAISADQTTTSLSVEQKIIEAKSKADHEALATQYEKEAAELQTKAKEHKEMAEAYGKIGFLEGKHDLVRHCNNLVQKYDDAAKENLALARVHRSLAEKSKQ